VPGITETGLTLLWAAAILTLYTGIDYFRASIDHLREDEPAKKPQPPAAERESRS
ncbi:MAG: CDP-diacylglycerol--glycerol-3-phosphate 3-phosphatidyltransferase, partial [Pseudomonadota bacterium]